MNPKEFIKQCKQMACFENSSDEEFIEKLTSSYAMKKADELYPDASLMG